MSNIDNVSSAARMPAEWETHEATWLAWPHARTTWPSNLAAAQEEFIGLVREISETEIAFVLIGDDVQAASILEKMPGVVPVPIATNDSWIRDFGPTFTLTEGRLRGQLWRFNAWGAKYEPHDLDRNAGRSICEFAGIDFIEHEQVVEGGALECNGQGILLTTRSCLLDPRRNPEPSAEDLVQLFVDSLGVDCCHILEQSYIPGDDTDGHIDQLARFVDPGTVVVAVTDHRHHSFDLSRNRHLLERLDAGQRGPLEVIPLPLPQGPVVCGGDSLPASYCNFYIHNEKVLVPQFDDRQDARALAILTDLFPNRTVRGLPSRQLLVGLGSFHCLTQQQPAVPSIR